MPLWIKWQPELPFTKHLFQNQSSFRLLEQPWMNKAHSPKPDLQYLQFFCVAFSFLNVLCPIPSPVWSQRLTWMKKRPSWSFDAYTKCSGLSCSVDWRKRWRPSCLRRLVLVPLRLTSSEPSNMKAVWTHLTHPGVSCHPGGVCD